MKKKTTQQQYYPVALTNDTGVRLKNLASFGIDVTQPRSVQIITIDPIMAQTLLTHNTRNRRVTAKTVNDYKKSMLDGKWNFEGYISFDSTGSVTNGQHRLWAICESGMTYDFVVVFGMDLNADTDTGKKRTAYENIHLMNNFPQAITNKKVVGCVMAMLRRKNKGHEGATNNEVETAMEHWKGQLVDMAHIINTNRGSTWFNVALMAAYLNGVDINEIQTFKSLYVSMWSRGKVPTIEQPIKALHDTLRSLAGGGTDQHMGFIMTATQNALNEYINRTGYNQCISSKAPIWDYDCSFLNVSQMTGAKTSDMHY